MQDKGNESARPRSKKMVHNKSETKSKSRARLDIGFKGASQRSKSKVQDIGVYKLARQKFKTLDSTKMQDKRALHIRHIGREGI